MSFKCIYSITYIKFKITIFIANLHAYLNNKGTLDELNEVAKYNIKCFKALGLSEIIM